MQLTENFNQSSKKNAKGNIWYFTKLISKNEKTNKLSEVFALRITTARAAFGSGYVRC